MTIFLSERVEQYRFADQELSAAYERVGAATRSRLKQNIAWNAAVSGIPGGDVATARSIRRQGGRLVTERTAMDWTLVLAGNGFLSPGPVLAGCVYPLWAGVREVVVLRETGKVPVPDGILAGLELAGLESFGQCPAEEMLDTIRFAQETGGHGAILVLGTLSSVVEAGLGEVDIPVHRVGTQGRVGTIHVLCDDVSAWDWDFLAGAYPGATFVVGGVECGSVVERLPAGVDAVQCSRDKLFLRECDLFLHPDPATSEPVSAQLCLGPGQEGAWIWPQLHPAMFEYVTIRLFS
ncbi:MAG TPA: hypothetical protein VJ934_13820 [Desulfomicrobiaceae bacterium]|nr:hypothetical protein [Desulfomicrobiaceae bacterium]